MRVLTIAIALALPLSAAAQGVSTSFEVTPYAAYRIGGEFEDDVTGELFDLNDSSAYGLVLNMRAKPEGQWELMYSAQSTEVNTPGSIPEVGSITLDVEHVQLGGTYLFEGDRAQPFVALTLGVAHFDPQLADLDSETYFSGSLGVGFRLLATDRLGVRLEGRVYSTFLEGDSKIFCSSTLGVGECLIETRGTTFNQWEARAGLILRF